MNENTKISEIPATLYCGTNWIEPEDMTIGEMASAEAASINYASSRNMRTAVCTQQGRWLSWRESGSDDELLYREMVQKELDKMKD